MGPVEMGLRERAHQIHTRLLITRPPSPPLDAHQSQLYQQEIHQLKYKLLSLQEELSTAKERIKELDPAFRPHPVHRIIDLVCITEGVGRIELLSARRTSVLCRARQIGYYLAATMTTYSLPQIGRCIRRDHTTIIHGRDKIINLRKIDRALNKKLRWYEKELGNASS